MTTSLTAKDILAMPLDELRERVALAERLSIAARHSTGSTDSAVAATPASTAARTTAQATAPVKPAATPTPQQSVASTPPADDFGEDALNDGAASGDFALSDDTAGDDMLAGFVEELSPEDAKVKAIEIAKQVIAKKDNKELDTARGIMKKYNVNKVSEIAAGKEVELYNDFKAGFPQYAG